MGSGIMGVIGALAITLGLLALAIHLLKRLQSGTAAHGRGVRMQILQRIAVGPKQGVGLLRIGDRVLVVSIAESGTALLTELSGQPLADALDPGNGTNGGGKAPVFRIPGFGPAAMIVALLLAPIAARAQGAGAPAIHTEPAPTSTVASATRTTPTTSTRIVRTAVPAGLVSTPKVGGPAMRGFGVAAPAPPKVEIQLGEGKDALHLSGAVGLVVFLGFLTLLPALFMLMTSFTRILIVLHFLRSALGTQTTPPSQLLVAISVLLTGVVMNPVLQKTNEAALQPYLKGQITQAQAYSLGVQPFREFMLGNTRTQDLTMFTELSGAADSKSMDEVPTVTLVSAFVTSELRTAFQMGFVIFLPFLVVDVIVASVLMSLGMFMLPPAMISLPFKLLLFVLADGWTLVVQNLVASFR